MFRRTMFAIELLVCLGASAGVGLADENDRAQLPSGAGSQARSSVTQSEDRADSPADDRVGLRISEIEAQLEKLKRDVGVQDAEADADGPSSLLSPILGTGNLKLGGLFQVWYVDDQFGTNEFRVRRAEIALRGHINDQVGFTAMVDPSKTLSSTTDGLVAGGAPVTSGGTAVSVLSPVDDDKILQDLFISFSVIPNHVIHVGQKHVPIGMEGLAPSGELDFAERSILGGGSFQGVRGYGDVRDLGVQLDGKYPWLSYTIGAFNGEGPNESDANKSKDFGVRAVVTPWKWLHLGGSRYDGETGSAKALRQRTGAEAAILREKFTLKAEYGRGRDGQVTSQGWYLATTYRFNGLQLCDVPFDLQAAMRYEEFDPDRSVTGDSICGPTVGVNVLLDDHNAKIVVNYTYFNVTGQDESQFIGALQVAF